MYIIKNNKNEELFQASVLSRYFLKIDIDMNLEGEMTLVQKFHCVRRWYYRDCLFNIATGIIVYLCEKKTTYCHLIYISCNVQK